MSKILLDIKKDIEDKNYKELNERLKCFEIGSTLTNHELKKQIHRIQHIDIVNNIIHIELNITDMHDTFCIFDRQNFIDKSIEYLKEQGYNIEPIKPEPPKIDILKDGVCEV